MNVVVAVGADYEAAAVVEPREGALDDLADFPINAGEFGVSFRLLVGEVGEGGADRLAHVVLAREQVLDNLAADIDAPCNRDRHPCEGGEAVAVERFELSDASL